MKGLTNSLAILALLAGAVLAAAPALDHTGSSARAAQGGVTITAIIRGPAAPPRLPLTGLQASAEGYVIAVRWANPVVPYSGALIEWDAERVRRGSSDYLTWRGYELHYPPASWAQLSAPMGARYTVRGSALYDGGATSSVPATASVVVTAPVEITSSLPTTGYAASTALRGRYGRTPYEQQFETRLQVPGGSVNYTMGSNPISWSAQLAGAPVLKIYKLNSKLVQQPGQRVTTRQYWTPVPIRPLSGPARHHRSLANGRITFADGYPAVSRYPFVWTEPGVYKLVMQGQLSDGFDYQGSQTWESTRYITLAPTKFRPTLKAPGVKGKRLKGKKLKFAGTISPRQSMQISVSIQRRLRGKWRPYKAVNVKSKSAGAWTAKVLVKKSGTFRVRAAVAAGVADPYHEYTASASRWRSFVVR